MRVYTKNKKKNQVEATVNEKGARMESYINYVDYN